MLGADSGMPGMPGDPVPPRPSLALLLGWAPDTFFLFVIIVSAFIYSGAVVRLHHRGDSWPWLRSLSFAFGLLLFLTTTCTGLGTYGMWLFSVHMVQHMLLSMIVPLFLLLGAPITLALRALSPARAGHTGAREILVAVLHSRFVRVLASPLFTLPLFIGSLYGLYFTPLLDTLMSSAIGHDVMLIHFLMVGLLFFWPIVGVDPAPHRSPYVIRILEMFAAMPFHAFFGVALMMSSTLVTSVFAHPPATWGADPAVDQATAGGLAWGFGELPTIIVLLVLFVQWAKSDEREARRTDRKADRDGDDDLRGYNAYLADLAQRGV